MLIGNIEDVPLYTAVGTGSSMLANRLSYFYDLRGLSIVVDTACSSSLVAVSVYS
jgi:acyl transferase domain-containing protein